VPEQQITDRPGGLLRAPQNAAFIQSHDCAETQRLAAATPADKPQPWKARPCTCRPQARKLRCHDQTNWDLATAVSRRSRLIKHYTMET
jgi:hypothetical protein